MATGALQKNGNTRPDMALLLSRLEKRILAGPLEKPWQDVLHDQRIITRLDPDQQIRLAELAQMAGEMEAALAVYALVNRTRPELEDAWMSRLELLAVLDRREEGAAVLAEIKRLGAKKLYARGRDILRGGDIRPVDDELEPDATPFVHLHQRRALLDRYAALFCGREDCFARQWFNKTEGTSGYVPVRRPMTHGDIEDHLAGRKTYGLYLFAADGTVRTAVLDVDINEKYRGRKPDAAEKRAITRQKNYLLARLPELSRNRNLYPLLEFSGGKGYHFWYFFDRPVDPGPVRSTLEELRREIAKDVPAFNIEVFPKQDKLTGKGLGNLVKLPLGVHRLTGKKSFFIVGRAGSRDEAEQLGILSKVRRTAAEEMKHAGTVTEKKNVIVHPGLKKFSQDYPELYRLESACPPLGQLLVECRNQRQLMMREEKIIYQTIGFLPRGRMLVHYLLAGQPEYNPHLVDYRISRVRGTPLGCKRIHSLLNMTIDFCEFKNTTGYSHPLLHLPQWREENVPVSEKTESLSTAVEQLKLAIIQVERFLK